MSLSGAAASGKTATNVSRRPKQPSLTSLLGNTNKLLPAETIELELFGPVAIDAAVDGPPATSGSPPKANKAALQKLASSFVALNKRKAENRNRGQNTWKSLIQNAFDLQKGKIPLLLAVEAGNQSMCRELLSSQTVDQLKVSVKLCPGSELCPHTRKHTQTSHYRARAHNLPSVPTSIIQL